MDVELHAVLLAYASIKDKQVVKVCDRTGVDAKLHSPYWQNSGVALVKPRRCQLARTVLTSKFGKGALPAGVLRCCDASSGNPRAKLQEREVSGFSARALQIDGMASLGLARRSTALHMPSQPCSALVSCVS